MDPDQIVSENRPQLYQARRQTQRETLLQLAETEAEVECWHTPDQEPWATFTVADTDTVPFHMEHYPLEGRGSGGAYNMLVWLYWRETWRAPGGKAVQEALDTLKARALHGGEEHRVYLRMAPFEGAIYYDLGDPSWQAIRIDAEGWRSSPLPPVRFRRTRGMAALPMPVPGGRLEQLREVAHLTDEAWVLFRGFLIACLMPEGPYPILEVGGQYGSSKSWLAEIAKALLDPDAKQPLRLPPKDEESLFVGAMNSRILAFDNLHSLPSWFSDGLCCLATGAGYRTRKRYTDQEESETDACLPVILTGITDLALRSDLQSRESRITQEPIPDHRRRPMKDLRRQLEGMRPALLGVLFDAASLALRSQETPPELSRMADMDLWIHRASPALGLAPGEFQRVQAQSRAEAHRLAIEASPIGELILKLVEEGPWVGTMSTLLDLLKKIDPQAAKARYFPSNAARLAGALTQIQPPLRQLGIQASFRREGHEGRKVWTICKKEGEEVNTAPGASASDSERQQASAAEEPTRLDAGVVDYARAREDPWLEEQQRILQSLEENRPTDLEDDDDGEDVSPGSGHKRPGGDAPSGEPVDGRRDEGAATADGAAEPAGVPDGGGGQQDRGSDPQQLRPYEAGGPPERPWSNPRPLPIAPAGPLRSRGGAAEVQPTDALLGSRPLTAPQTPQEPRGWEPSDPGALIAVLGPQGRLWGRTARQLVEPDLSMLTEALGGAAAAGARQLVLAGGTERTLALPAPDRKTGALVGSCPALDHARAAGWVITSFESTQLRPWSRASHPRATGVDHWIDLVFLERDRDLEPFTHLGPEQLLEALQLLARLLDTRLATTPAKTWRTLAQKLGINLEVAQLPGPAAEHWGRDHAMDDIPTWWREPTEEEWGRRWAWAFDRSGSWLAALAGFDVGRGEVLRLEGPEARRRLSDGRLEGFWYVRAPEALSGSPPLLERAEGWVTDPTLQLLRDTHTPFQVERAEVWSERHRPRPFDRIQRRVREARTALLKRQDAVGEAALEVLKLVYGGGANSLRYGGAGPAYHRPDLYEALIARARANLQRPLRGSGAVVIGYHAKDSVILVSDRETGAEVAQEAGLDFGPQLGRWHDTGRVSMQELQDRHRAFPEVPLTRAFAGALLKARRRG